MLLARQTLVETLNRLSVTGKATSIKKQTYRICHTSSGMVNMDEEEGCSQDSDNLRRPIRNEVVSLKSNGCFLEYDSIYERNGYVDKRSWNKQRA